MDQDEFIQVRINSVLGEFNLPDNTKSLLSGGKINVTNLGISEKNYKTSKWIYNISPIYKINLLN